MPKDGDHNKDEWSDDDHGEDEGSDDDHDEDEGSDDDDGFTFYCELFKIAGLDDRQGFIKLIEGPYRRNEILRTPWGLFRHLCSKGAVNCVTALLDGEVDPPLELNVDPKRGLCPLHEATAKMSYSVVDLLLRYGAATDLKSEERIVTRGGLLPLNIALEKLRVPLEVSRLLASNTKRVYDILYYYAMEGKLIEMAALLLVARENVMAGFNGRMHLRQFISEETAAMHADERKLTGCGKRGKWASAFKDKRLVMTSALELLEVFERAGDCIEAYAQSVRIDMPGQEVINDIKFLLEENGFDLKGEDIDLNNIDCALHVDDKIKLEMQGLEMRRVFLGQSKDVGKLVFAQSGHFDTENHLVTNKPNETALSTMRLFRPGSPLVPTHNRVSSHPYSSSTSYSFLPKKTTTKKILPKKTTKKKISHRSSISQDIWAVRITDQKRYKEHMIAEVFYLKVRSVNYVCISSFAYFKLCE